MSTDNNLHHSISYSSDYLHRHTFVFVLDIMEYFENLSQNQKLSIGQKLLDAAATYGEEIHTYRNQTDNIKNKNEIISAANKLKYWLNLCKYAKDFPNPKHLLTTLNTLINFTENQII